MLTPSKKAIKSSHKCKPSPIFALAINRYSSSFPLLKFSLFDEYFVPLRLNIRLKAKLVCLKI